MTVSILSAYAAGLFTAFSPCILPLTPILVGGLAVGDDVSRWSRLRATLWFVLGFAAVFVLLGLGVLALANVVRPLRPLLLSAAAAILLLYGLKMMHVVGGRHLAWMDRTLGARPPRPGRGHRHALALGVIFGLTWTPCAGPILGGVLTYVATQHGVAALGSLMLLAYAAGVATPLMLVAAVSEYVTVPLRRLGRHLRGIELASGAGVVALSVVVLLQALPDAATPPLTTPATLDGHEAGVKQLLFFHSEHCPVCRAMEATLPAIVAACRSDRWTLERVDVDRAESAVAVDRLDVRAVPTVSLLDERGDEIAHLVGYQTPSRLRETLEHGVPIACARLDAPADADPNAGEGHVCDVGKAC